MNNTLTPGFMVYWTEPNGFAGSTLFSSIAMSSALDFMAELRTRPGVQFVTFVSQHDDSVGKPGVDSIKDGKTPDGQIYDWKKRRV